MTKFFLLLTLPLLLNASKILSYNIYDTTDRVDVMITFDTPYEGTIKQKSSDSKIIIKLENTSIESTKTKVLSSNFLDTISIVPLAGYTEIVAKTPEKIKFKASKTSDAYGLRLRFTKLIATANTNTKKATQAGLFSSTSVLPTKKDENVSSDYYVVTGLVLVGIVILFIFKNRINSTREPKNSDSLLFKTAKDSQSGMSDSLTIRFQKNIDENNRVVMLDLLGQSYLVLMGSNNLLLDKFTNNKPVTQDDFDTILQNRHQELDDFFKKEESLEKDPVQIYKEKAANISYTS